MAYTVRPDDDVVSLPPTEWKDLTEAEDALSRLARVSNAGGAAQTKSFADADSRGPLADATLFVEAGKVSRRRVGRALLRYLIAVGLGVAGTLAYQQYGEQAQQTVERWIPQLVWPGSSAVQASVPVLPPVPVPAPPYAIPVEQAVAEQVTPPMPPAPPVASPPNDTTASDLADLRRTIERLTASQAQMAREISTLRAVRPEARPKIAAPPPSPVAAVAVLPPPPPPAPLPQRAVPAPPPLD